MQSVENYWDKNVNANSSQTGENRFRDGRRKLRRELVLRKEGDNVYVLSAKVRYVVRNSPLRRAALRRPSTRFTFRGPPELPHIAR
jgi:hypothetical protein